MFVFELKDKQAHKQGKEKEIVIDCHLSAAATTRSVMPTVGMLGHLNRTPTITMTIVQLKIL